MTHASRLLPLVVLAVVAGRAAADEAQAMAAAVRHVAAHEAAIVGELRELIALPNVATNAGRHPRERGPAGAHAGKTRHRCAHPRDARRTCGRLRRAARAGREAHAAFLCALRRPAGRRRRARGSRRRSSRCCARAAPRTGRRRFPWAEAKFPLPDEARIYARSSSDDKGPIVAMLAALDALDAAKIPLSANLKFFLEGEEEAGSPNLARTLATHRGLLGSDLWVFGDGPIDPRGLPRLVAGRARRDGFPPDRVRAGDQPALRPLRQRRAESRRAPRARSIASMRAADGGITIDGLEAPAPSADDARARAHGFRHAGHARVRGDRRDRERPRLRRVVLRPSLNVTQLLYGGAGGQRNAIDAEATAGFDLRLVPGMTVAGARAAIEAHVGEAGLRAARRAADGRGARAARAARALRVGRRRISGRDVGPGDPGRRARDRGDARGDRTARCVSRR